MPARSRWSTYVLLMALIGLSAPLRAGILIGAPGDIGVGDCVPFGCSDVAVYQQIFDRSLFSGPATIAGITFFLRNFDNTDPLTGGPIVPNTIYAANYTVVLSLVGLPVNGLDATLENNVDPLTSRTFFIGFLSDTVSDHFTIQTSPANYFSYDPASGQNLLLEIFNEPADPTDLSLTLFLDVNSSSSGHFSSAFDSNPHPSGCPDGSPGVTTGCTDLNRGLVVEFNGPSGFSSAPEPAALWLVALGGAALIVWKKRR